MESPKPAMRGKYSIRNPVANLLLRGIDAGLRLTLGWSKPARVPVTAQRILISNIAHLGDVIVATSVLPALRDRFPEAEFGFLVGSWSLAILEGHPLVKQCHVIDHWMQNRASLSHREKWRIYRRTRTQALREIKAMRYDIAIDLFWNMPNTLPFLWQTDIPIRVGYGSAGFGTLATHCVELTESRLHISDRHRLLLAQLSVDTHGLSLMKPTLSAVPTEVWQELTQCLGERGINQDHYLVFHPGASTSIKEWPEDNWRQLALKFTEMGYDIVFTGYGVPEEAMIQRVIAGLPKCISLCSSLPWQNFVGVIQQACLLVSVDTVAGHIAGAIGTPSVVLTNGRNPYLWKPMGTTSQTLMAPVPCAPCHINNGCAGMECIRNLEVSQVRQTCLELLKHRVKIDLVSPSQHPL